jgi:hypothetical protein
VVQDKVISLMRVSVWRQGTACRKWRVYINERLAKECVKEQ